MKKILLFYIWLDMFIFIVISGNSQTIIPQIDSSLFKNILGQQINPFCGIKQAFNICNSEFHDSEEEKIEPFDEGCSYAYSNTISFPSFGISNVPSPDVHISTANNPELSGAEVSVCVDPNPNQEKRIKACYMLGWNVPNSVNIACLYSDNKGINNSWNDGGFDLLAAGDPINVVNNNSHWFISYLSSKYVNFGIYLGSHWGSEQEGSPGDGFSYDKPFLGVDYLHPNGNFYCGWTVFSSAKSTDEANQIEVTQKTGESGGWGTSQVISNSGIYENYNSGNQGVNIQTSPNGEVYAVWSVTKSLPNCPIFGAGGTRVCPESGLVFNRSFNGGITYDGLGVDPNGKGVIIREIHGIAAYQAYNANEDWSFKPTSLNSMPSMCVDKSGGPRNGRIYVVWAEHYVDVFNVAYNRIDVFIIWNDNYGAVNDWHSPVRVNQSPLTSGEVLPYHSFHPWICCDDESGVLAVIFYDDSDLDPENGEVSGTIDCHVALSNDYGSTWEECRVSDNKFTPGDTYFFGDYIGICAKKGITYPTFTSTANSGCIPKVYISPFYTWNCIDHCFTEHVITSYNIKEREVSDYITSKDLIEENGVSIYNAGNEITFLPIDENDLGFWAQEGSFVHAYIDGCEQFPSSNDNMCKNQQNKESIMGLRNQSEMNVKAFPNPSNGKFQIDFKDIEINGCSLEITNSVGTPVYSTNVLDKSTINIDISNDPKGIYLIKLYSKDRTYVNKMVCK